ncbi:MAG: MFS transporter [Oscillospiraceae bacterium]|nr:MFS transporter [Oscillospiraceae bacterium]
MENKQNSNVFLFSKYFVLISLFLFLNSLGLQTFNTISSLYVVSLGGKASSAGLMLTCFTIAATILRFAGNIADRIGRLKIILIGVVIFAVGSSLMYFSSIPLMFPARFLQGVGYSLSSTGVGVAIADVIPRQRMNEGIGYHNIFSTVAYTAGPTVALLCCSQGKGPFHPALTLGIVCMALILALIPFSHYDRDQKFLARKAEAEGDTAQLEAPGAEEPAEQPKGLARVIEKSVLPIMIPNVCYSMNTAASVTCLALYASEIGIVNISSYFLLNSLCSVGTRLLLGKVIGRTKTSVCAAIGFSLMAASFTLIGLSAHLHNLIFLAAVLQGSGASIASPTVNTEVIHWAPKGRRGAAVATYLVFIDITMGVGAYLWGLVADLTGSYQPVFYATVFFCLLGAVSGALIFRRKLPTDA